jgi:hypothetical protein
MCIDSAIARGIAVKSHACARGLKNEFSIISRDRVSGLGKQVEWFYSEDTKLRREALNIGALVF